MAPSNAELQQQVKEREVWFQFFAANREIYSLANKGFLDEWLTQNGKSLTIPELTEAYEALKPTGRLHIIRPEDQPRRVIDETPATPTASAQGGDDQLPPNMPSRKELRAMSGSDFLAACKKYGEKNCTRVYYSPKEA